MKCHWMAVILASWLGLMGSPAAADSPVVEFVQVETGSRTAEYLSTLQGVLARMKAIRPEMNSRVFRAAYAGKETGALYVLNEFPSLKYFAESLSAFERDDEYLKGIAQLRDTGRVLVGESILFDVTP